MGSPAARETPCSPAAMNFKLMSDYEPRGDQPEAIEQLSRGIEAGEKHQVLLGVTARKLLRRLPDRDGRTADASAGGY